MQQKQQSRQAEDTGNAARCYGENLLGAMRYPHRIKNRNGRKQTDKVAAENHQDARMEENAAPD